VEEVERVSPVLRAAESENTTYLFFFFLSWRGEWVPPSRNGLLQIARPEKGNIPKKGSQVALMPFPDISFLGKLWKKTKYYENRKRELYFHHVYV
jgi:hypothetical protein